jgi:hypothetical protein
MEDESVVVQLDDDFEVVSLAMDDVAAYVELY